MADEGAMHNYVGVWDYIVFGISVGISLGIGVYHALTGGKQNTTEEYLLGNRKLSMLPVALSLVVTFESSILMLGHPADVYIYGVMIFWDAFAVASAFLIGARIVVPVFHPLKVTSVYEYLELRYKCRGPRLLAMSMGFLFYILYMGIVLYGPALALHAAVGIPVWVTTLVVAAVAMCYTVIGGIKAVIWADVLQCVIMNAGIVAVIVQVAVVAGGFGNIFAINGEYKRLNFFDFRPNPTIRHTFWGTIFGQTFRSFSFIFNQSTIQRISSLETKKQAKRLMYVAAPIFCLMGVLIVIEGLSSFAFFNILGCDPLESKQINNPNQIIPVTVFRLFSNMYGLSGLFIAALFSASLSTISSGLSSLSALLTEDLVRPKFKKMSDARLTFIAKVSVVVFGSLTLCIALVMANVGGSLLQIYGSFTAAVGGPLSGIFLYSILCPWATKQGAITGGIFSLVFMLWITLGQTFSPTFRKQPWLPPNPTDNCFPNSTYYDADSLNSTMSYLIDTTTANMTSTYNYDQLINDYWNWQPQGLDALYSLSYQWYAAVSTLLVLFIGTVVSLIIGYPPPEEVDVKYLLPIGDTLFPYLPKRARKFLEFGLNFEKRRIAEDEEELAKLRDKECVNGNAIVTEHAC